ncbi:hypothetical protein B0H14DRAFT_2782194 [Mycena olivaceomarginata]|nr:hypothetical protein B0H14DRAFT_2883111 [Mycena olivaceomarginata]KAJ7841807.1 hypothetical protein B0H14DRAFT_2782194 [Mycena olivaceomarginata]
MPSSAPASKAKKASTSPKHKPSTKNERASTKNPTPKPWKQMVLECLASVTSRKGVSRQEIKKRIQQKYNLDTPRDSTNCKRLNRAIRGIIEDGGFWQPKGTSGKIMRFKPTA